MSTQSLRLAPNLCPSLTEEIFAKLKEENINNGIDLLSRDLEELSAKIRVSYKILHNICKVVNAFHGASRMSGLDLYKEALKSCQIVSTGFDGLDKILGGGFLSEEIVEIFGCSGSGKSTFCLSLSLHIALRERGSVTFIDPTHSINFTCIKTALTKLLPTNPEEVEEALSHIRLFHPRDVWQLFTLIEELSKEDHRPFNEEQIVGSKGDFREERRCRLVVLDSFPQLILSLIGGSPFDSFGVLNHLANLMRGFVQRRKSSLVIVNNATKTPEDSSPATPEMKPTLGRYWMHVPDTRLLLERVAGNSWNGNCRVRITKSTRLKKDSVEIRLN